MSSTTRKVHVHAACQTSFVWYTTKQNDLCQHVSKSIQAVSVSLSLPHTHTHTHTHTFCCILMSHHHFDSVAVISHVTPPLVCLCSRMCDTSSIRNRQLVPMWQRCHEALCVSVCVWCQHGDHSWHPHAESDTWAQFNRVSQVTWLFGVMWHILTGAVVELAGRQSVHCFIIAYVAQRAHRESERNKRAEIECISIYISLSYLLIHDSAASLLNACSSEELSLPEHWSAGQLHSLD